MTAPNLWLEALYTIGPAAFNGLLSQRSAARETRRAGGESEVEAEVPAAWRIPRNDRGVPASGRPHAATASTAQTTSTRPDPTATPPSPSPAAPPVATPVAPRLVFTSTLQPWNGVAPAEPRPSPPPSSSPVTAGPIATPKSPEVTMHPSPSADLPPPQLELDFSPRPPIPPPTAAPASAGAPPQQLDMLLAFVARLLDDVVGQAAGEAVGDALARLEQSHARDLAALAGRFEAALERQETRSRELLERQDERLRALLERQDERLREVLTCEAQAHARALREVACEQSERTTGAPASAPSPEAWQEIQETLRLGFGEVRSALDRNNRELTKLRAERAPPPIAAPRPPEPAAPERATPADTAPISAPAPRARSSPLREDRAASQRRFDALADDEAPTDDAIEDPPHRPLRYQPPDDAELSSTQEASP